MLCLGDQSNPVPRYATEVLYPLVHPHPIICASVAMKHLCALETNPFHRTQCSNEEEGDPCSHFNIPKGPEPREPNPTVSRNTEKQNSKSQRSPAITVKPEGLDLGIRLTNTSRHVQRTQGKLNENPSLTSAVSESPPCLLNVSSLIQLSSGSILHRLCTSVPFICHMTHFDTQSCDCQSSQFPHCIIVVSEPAALGSFGHE